jgi:hypothetical protein
MARRTNYENVTGLRSGCKQEEWETGEVGTLNVEGGWSCISVLNGPVITSYIHKIF